MTSSRKNYRYALMITLRNPIKFTLLVLRVQNWVASSYPLFQQLNMVFNQSPDKVFLVGILSAKICIQILLIAHVLSPRVRSLHISCTPIEYVLFLLFCYSALAFLRNSPFPSPFVHFISLIMRSYITYFSPYILRLVIKVVPLGQFI